MKPLGITEKNALGEPILINTEHALEYARVIYDLSSEVDVLRSCLAINYKRYDAAQKKWEQMADDLSQLATKNQLYRECLEEVARLRTSSGFKVLSDER